MKRLLTLIALALATASSFGATLNPIQLLNPAGSAAGQAIVSTGPSSAPAWGNVTATGLSPVAANSVIANFTGSTAAPVAFSMPTCSAAGRALQYSGSGIVCTSNYALTTGTLAQFAATTSAQLLGVISDETGSGALVFGTSPTLSTPVISAPTIANGTMSGTAITNSPISGAAASFTTLSATGLISPASTIGIKGTATNDNAQAGSDGEYSTGSTAATSLTTSTGVAVASISLTAGDWDVQATANFHPAGTTTISGLAVSTNTTSGTVATSNSGTTTYLILPFQTGQQQIISAPVTRISLAATTTLYVNVYSIFGTSTMTADGFIRARRVR